MTLKRATQCITRVGIRTIDFRGRDGFFIVRQSSRTRLRLAAALRGLRADRWLHLLPGVERIPGRPCSLLVTQRRGHINVMQVLQLLGYRRESRSGEHLALTRRPYNQHPPDSD